MARRDENGHFIIAAGEVSAFSVCPQSWHLKWNKREKKPTVSLKSELGQRLHSEWSSFFDESLRIGKWMRILVALIYFMMLVFMLINSARTPLYELFQFSLRNPGLQLLFLLAVGLCVLRVFRRDVRQKRSEAGFSPREHAISLDGSSMLPEREYVSSRQGLAGKPDALIDEGGEIIPVERKPLGKKLRDRYVVQLLVYMRLVEEFEGRRPSHGYLILGPSCRRVRVENSESKQKWVDGLIKEMRRILDGADPIPTPHPIKCAKCDVRERCHARIDPEAQRKSARITS